MKMKPTTCRLTPKAAEILTKLEARHPGSERTKIIEKSLDEYQHRQAELTEQELKEIAEVYAIVQKSVAFNEGKGKERPGAAELARNGRTANEVLGRILARSIALRTTREARP